MCGVAILTLFIVGQPDAVIAVLEIIRVVVGPILQGLLPDLVQSDRSWSQNIWFSENTLLAGVNNPL